MTLLIYFFIMFVNGIFCRLGNTVYDLNHIGRFQLDFRVQEIGMCMFLCSSRWSI